MAAEALQDQWVFWSRPLWPRDLPTYNVGFECGERMLDKRYLGGTFDLFTLSGLASARVIGKGRGSNEALD